MMASHENADKRIRELGLGRMCHYFQSSAPIDPTSLNKIADYYYVNEAVLEVESEDEEERNQYAYRLAAVAEEEQEESDNDIYSCPYLEDNNYSVSSAESSENENKKEKEDWESLDDDDLYPPLLAKRSGWD
jgi:hypothetical protein